MLKLKSWLSLIALPVVAFLLPLGFTASVFAASSSSDQANSQPHITQAYFTDQQLKRGMIVGLNPAKPTYVEALKSDKIEQMQGVVVAANDAPVTISGSGNGDQVFVATLGRYPILVSNQNGPINTGDYITISSFAGIGMKADGDEQLVVGKAASGFSGKQNVLGNEQLKNGQKVDIGMISVDLGIAHNPLKTPAVKEHNPGVKFLLNLSKALTGQAASEARVFTALGMFIVTAIIVAIVLYSGIRGGMIAAGRNPLAKAAIGRNLFEVVMAAVVIFIIGLGAIYLTLKL